MCGDGVYNVTSLDKWAGWAERDGIALCHQHGSAVAQPLLSQCAADKLEMCTYTYLLNQTAFIQICKQCLTRRLLFIFELGSHYTLTSFR